MKKISLLILFYLVPIISTSQIFTKIEHLDKFDDVVKTENVKTLITKTDSTFVIETKGRTPITYYIFDILESICIGDSEVNNHERLVNNVFGYQECYLVSDLPFEEYIKLDEKQANNHILQLTHRVISKYKFVFEYENEYIWLFDFYHTNSLGQNIERIIYSTSWAK